MNLERCTRADFLEILADLEDFWGTDRARAVHHPMFVHEQHSRLAGPVGAQAIRPLVG